MTTPLIGDWRILIAFAFLLGVGNAEAASCGTIDHRAEMGPVWNQVRLHDPGWCSSYTASDLLSFRLKEKISAVGLALDFDYNVDVDKSVSRPWQSGGGSIKRIIEGGLQQGLCYEKDLNSQNFSVPGEKGETTENTTQILQEIDKIRTQYNPKNWDQVCRVDLNKVEQMFPRIDLPGLTSIVQKSTPSNFIGNLEKQDCQKNPVKVPSGLHVTEEDLTKNNAPAILASLNQQLNSGNIVGIEYDSFYIMGPQRQRSAKANNEDTSHSSSIVGRQLNPSTGKCEYLIRNSWGTYLIGPHGNFYADGLKVEQGNVWVSEELLTQMLNAIVYLN